MRETNKTGRTDTDMLDKLLNINSRKIENAIKLCYDSLEMLHLTPYEVDLEKNVRQRMSKYSADELNSELIITCVYEEAANIIETLYSYPTINYGCDINKKDGCYFEVPGQQTVYNMGLIGTNPDLIRLACSKGLLDEQELLGEISLMMYNRYIMEDILKSTIMGHADEREIYASIEELGAENADNGTREPDDTDEAFGNFLIDAYGDGHSNDIYVGMANDKAFSMPLCTDKEEREIDEMLADTFLTQNVPCSTEEIEEDER